MIDRSIPNAAPNTAFAGLEVGLMDKLFHDFAGLYSLEQAGAGDHAESNAQARDGRKLVVWIFFAHRSKVDGFELYDDHRQSISLPCADGREPSALPAGFI
jgi:hypothetical protein